MKEITVTVTGISGSGKSAIAQMVSHMLQSFGLEVTIEDDSHNRPLDANQRCMDAIAARGQRVKIVTQNERRFRADHEHMHMQGVAFDFMLAKAKKDYFPLQAPPPMKQFMAGVEAVSKAYKEDLAEHRKKEGLCPKCGVLGPYINLAPTCPDHGPY